VADTVIVLEALARALRGADGFAQELASIRAHIFELRDALAESVGLQSHYATLLNQFDGGQRRTFTVESWLARLAELRAPEGGSRG
jgi:hypothetical protein